MRHTSSMITCYNLTLEYTPGRKVLKDVSLKIAKGGFYFLTGASGAGKSTFLNILSLNIRPSSGKLLMDGKDVINVPHSELPKLRRKIGSVVQDFQLLDHLTVAENIALPQKIMGIAQDEIDAKVEQLLGWIEMSEFRDVKPKLLSGGQKQRVAIARAVINNPPLLLCDEPTGNLDPALRKRFMYLFESLNDLGTTVIFATHDEELIREFDYPILSLKDGVVKEGHLA